MVAKLSHLYPDGAKRFPGKRIPVELIKKLRALELIDGKKTPRQFNLMAILERLEARQGEFRERAPGEKRKAEKFGRAGPSYQTLQNVRETIAQLLIDRYKIESFLPMIRSRRGSKVATAVQGEGTIHRWVTVCDKDEHDVSGWFQERYREENQVYTLVEARELYRHAHNNAALIRVWLPCLGLTVHFTPTGKSPHALGTGNVRRGYHVFPFETLWSALKLKN